MIPLTLATPGESNIIKKVGGLPNDNKHMESLGRVPGGMVTEVSALGGNVIVSVEDSRVAISREMAQKIMI